MAAKKKFTVVVTIPGKDATEKTFPDLMLAIQSLEKLFDSMQAAVDNKKPVSVSVEIRFKNDVLFSFSIAVNGKHPEVIAAIDAIKKLKG